MSTLFLAKNLRYLAERAPDGLGLSAADLDRPEELGVGRLVALAEQCDLPLDALVRVDLSASPPRAEAAIELVILDIDGVLSDGGMYYSQSGDELKKFNTKDGLAIMRRARAGLAFGFLSSGFNDTLIRSRAELLGVRFVHVGKVAKLGVLEGWCRDMGIGLHQVAYVGDDINDFEVMQRVGLAVCPADAVLQIRQIAHIVLRRRGGFACVREFLDEHLPVDASSRP